VFCGGQGDSGRGLTPSTEVFDCQYHYTDALCRSSKLFFTREEMGEASTPPHKAKLFRKSGSIKKEKYFQYFHVSKGYFTKWQRQFTRQMRDLRIFEHDVTSLLDGINR
jgi:hypothetical protein